MRVSADLGADVPDQVSIVADVLVQEARLLTAEDTGIINATGTILHTGLGRAPLSDKACQAISSAAGYAVLDIDRSTGKRGTRNSLVEPQLRLLLGCEAAMTVTNNAAALFLSDEIPRTT